MLSSLRGHTAPHPASLAVVALAALFASLVACAPLSGSSSSPTTTSPTSTPTSTVREFPLTTKEYAPGAIAIGADDALWFIETASTSSGVNGKIGRLG